MTNINDSNTDKETIRTNDEEKTTIEEIKEIPLMEVDTNKQSEPAGATYTTDISSAEEINASNEEPSMHSEESEGEKHDISSKSDSEMKDNDINAQPLFEQPIVLDGKRSRRPTSRLDISDSTPSKKELSIPQGHGTPLSEIEYINYQISHASTDTLSRMRNICFGRRGHKATMRKNLREFKGFEFARNSDEYQKHLSNLIKLKKDQLKSISNILGLPATGRNTDHAERILNFLMKPSDEGKKVPGKRSTTRTPKRRRQTSKESSETGHEMQNEKTENNKDQDGADYIYKPGKKSSNKRAINDETTTNPKRKKRVLIVSESKENQETIATIDENKSSNDEVVKVNENDITESKLTEKMDQNETKTDNIIQDAN